LQEDIGIAVSSEMDPSGNGYNDNLKFIDLCHECAIKALRYALADKRVSYDVGRKILKVFKHTDDYAGY